MHSISSGTPISTTSPSVTEVLSRMTETSRKRLIFAAASQAQKAADHLLPKPTEVAALMPLAQAA